MSAAGCAGQGKQTAVRTRASSSAFLSSESVVSFCGADGKQQKIGGEKTKKGPLDCGRVTEYLLARSN